MSQQYKHLNRKGLSEGLVSCARRERKIGDSSSFTRELISVNRLLVIWRPALEGKLAQEFQEEGQTRIAKTGYSQIVGQISGVFV
jgi:hypothetical protein